MPKRPCDGSPDASSSPSSPFPAPASPASSDEHASKYMQTSNVATRPRAVMKCSLPPHTEVISFDTFEEFEVHYAKYHAYRCSECRHNFPSDHFLTLHISENHDPLNEVKEARGEKTLRCFVEDCDKVCLTAHKRRMHLIDKHMFPKVLGASKRVGKNPAKASSRTTTFSSSTLE